MIDEQRIADAEKEVRSRMNPMRGFDESDFTLALRLAEAKGEVVAWERAVATGREHFCASVRVYRLSLADAEAALEAIIEEIGP